ncbi:MAG: 5-(carboxyamino)imidazole ribonucleotide mutase [Gemmataceae bacterium]|nr:5-(carboxyamino)imidazole ribonucleotide mutase [Gemmataceae bacterium]
MLVLSRKAGQQVIIGNDIYVAVVAVRGTQVSLGFDAPGGVCIVREELRSLCRRLSTEAKTTNAKNRRDVSEAHRRPFCQLGGHTIMGNSQVGILMGSDSDLETMKQAADGLAEFGIVSELHVLSAHRTPDDTAEYARLAESRGIKVIIAGAGGAAHLPGVIAAHTCLPVIGVPIATKALQGLDSLYSIVQMPPGVPVATVGIGAGRNAGLLAVQILATTDAELRKQFAAFKKQLAADSRAKNGRLAVAK